MFLQFLFFFLFVFQPDLSHRPIYTARKEDVPKKNKGRAKKTTDTVLLDTMKQHLAAVPFFFFFLSFVSRGLNKNKKTHKHD